MFIPTYLYVKTHNQTGLKYFGKTTRKDPYAYSGSGKYWKRHLKKHGNDFSTEVIGYYTDKDSCILAAIEFSKRNNIIESNEWANFKIENGLDGGFSHLNDGSESHRKRSSEAGKKCHIDHPDLAKNNLSKGWTKEAKEKSAKTILDKYGKDYYKKIASIKKSEEHKNKIRESALRNKHIYALVSCPHCGKSGAANAMTRWHFKNCKKYLGGI